MIAGDLSGNAHTTRLAKEFVARQPGCTLHALGGRSLGDVALRTGGTWIGDTTNLSAIGLLSVLRIYLKARWLSFKMRRFVRRHPVDVAVLCDWGGFNCRQLKFFQKARVPVLYYFPPRSWQREGAAGLRFAPMVARVATPFEWSASRLQDVGCAAEWVGHPMLEAAEGRRSREELRRDLGVGAGERLIALLPGSRRSEIDILGPRMAAVAEILEKRGGVKFVVPVPRPMLERARACFPESFHLRVDGAAEVLAACDAAVVKMGSATLEAAVAGAPQVAVYDFGWACRVEWALLWMWKRIPFIAMPNIILQRKLVPEMLGLECTPAAIAAKVEELLDRPEVAAEMADGYREIRENLGSGLPKGATRRTSEILEEMLGLTDRREGAATP